MRVFARISTTFDFNRRVAARAILRRAIVVCAALWIGFTASKSNAQSAAPANPFTPAPANPATPVPSLAPTWDPYAVPGSAATPPPALAPYGTQPANPSLGFPFRDWTAPQTKLIQNFTLRYTWLRRTGGANGFGMDDVDLSTSLAFPFFNNVNTAPILVTPGFSFHFLQGPTEAAPLDLPPTVYDAFVQTSWRPQFTERLGADLALSVGVYSDYNFVNGDSFRILGRGVGTYQFNPQWQGVLGVIYLDRLDVKILPAFGAVWKPHDDAKFELLFPQPKLSQRITNYGNAQIWGYIGGEYGGGQWSIEHTNGVHDVVNYNDFRLFIGVETFGYSTLRAHVEVGYVFNRDIIYLNSPLSTIEPDDTLMIRAGASY